MKNWYSEEFNYLYMNMNVLRSLVLRAIIEKPYKGQPEILGWEIFVISN